MDSTSTNSNKTRIVFYNAKSNPRMQSQNISTKAPNTSIEIFLDIDLFIVSLELKFAISKSTLLILSDFIPNRPPSFHIRHVIPFPHSNTNSRCLS